MTILLKNCSHIITQDEERKILRNKDIGIEKGRIKEITEQTQNSYDQEIDCSQKIIMPGLVNMHTHAGMSLMRGYSDDKELFSWLEDIWKIEGKLTRKEVKIGTELSILEMIKTGTTTFMDMYFALNDVPKVVEQTGIRAYLGWAVFDPEKSTQKREPIKNAENFAKKHAKKELVKPVIAPHAVYTCPDDLYIKSKEVADKQGILLHTHAAETRKEVFDCIKQKGKRVIEHLDNLEVLDENTSLAHVGWITKKEAETLGKKQVTIAHCPISNMKLATGGVCPYPELKQAGANFTLGTDGPVSNNSLNMLETMKITSLIQKHSRWDPSIATAQEVLDMATRNPSKHLQQETGQITQGKQADIITLNINSIGNTPLYNVVSNIVYSLSISNPIKDVIVNGKITMQQGRMKTMDEEEVRKKAIETSRKLI